MELKGFGIKNYRSFDENGVFINSIKKINIFIGKNNSGKSNVLRFLKKAQEVALRSKERSYPLNDEFRRNGKSPSITFIFSSEDLIEKADIKHTQIKIDVPLANFEAIFNSSFHTNYANSQFITLQYEDKEAILLIQQAVARKAKNFFNTLTKIEYIPQFRQIIETNNSDEKKPLDFNGNDIIHIMFKMQNPDIGHEADRIKFDNVQEFVRDLLKNDELKIEIPNTKDKIIVEINEARLPLSHLGTGIHQIIILCCALEIYTDTIFCIEEPEIHLHPELQRKFLDLLKRTNNIYFITTHSNVFLDYDEDISVYHVTHDGKKSSITNIDSSKKNHEILDDLGYKNSDILQANGIIWVEGPSDRVFINQWLSLKRPDLEEGLHYSILFYGGRLLSNLSYSLELIDRNLIPLLKINRNAYVVIDKDGKKISDKLNATKERIKKEIGDNKCWITKGREIENYLSESTIKQWLRKKTGLEIPFKYSPQEKIEDSIKKSNTSSKSIKYEENKNVFSKEIIHFIGEDAFSTLDLGEKVDEIITWIDKWNA